MSAATRKPKSEGAPERRIVPDVVRQHAEQAAFFWAQRDTLMEEDPPDPDVVAGIDRRLEANLDGLRIAGPAAWPFVVAAYEDFPRRANCSSTDGWRSSMDDGRRVVEAVEFGRQSKDDARGLVGALAWHKPGTIAPLVRDWIGRRMRSSGFSAYRPASDMVSIPKQMLARLVRDPDTRVRATSLRLAGKLKRADLVQRIDSRLERCRRGHPVLGCLGADGTRLRRPGQPRIAESGGRWQSRRADGAARGSQGRTR